MTENDLVTITSGDLSARINPLGAELWSITDRQGREWMTDADPAFWTGHAPVLFPIVGALNGDCYRVDGREFTLPKHGFARRSRFEQIEATERSARFRLTDSAETRSVYPFAFALELAFTLEGERLEIRATVSNPGMQALPFSFGFHPAFAWPLPGGAAKADHRIVFERDEPRPIRAVDVKSGLLLPTCVPTPVEGRTIAPSADMFAADALIWDDLSSRSLTFGAEGGGSLDIAFPDTPMLGIWQKPGAAYLCVEPWQGHADPVGFSGDLREKPGVILLEPGGALCFAMTVTVRPAG